MSFRYMRIILFFDLPTLTSEHQRAYRRFVKNIKKDGFYMLQESVYVKMAIDKQVADSSINRINNYLPKEGNVITLVITEKQFSTMNIILGESKTDVVNDVDRVVVL